MIFITGVHYEGTKDLRNITAYKWENSVTREFHVASRSELVNFVGDYPGFIFVKDSRRARAVVVVDDTPQYLRTQTEDPINDSLLDLPQF